MSQTGAQTAPLKPVIHERASDRTTKALLAVIAIALVGLLARSFFAVTPIQAAEGAGVGDRPAATWVRISTYSTESDAQWVNLEETRLITFRKNGDQDVVYADVAGTGSGGTGPLDPATVQAVRRFLEQRDIMRWKP